jgi:hypothetical protein
MLSDDIEEVIRLLEAAPARFQAALGRMEDADSVAGGAPGEWSPLEVLAHVRASNDILEPRLFQILVRDKPTLFSLDERRWMEVARYTSIPVTESLAVMRLKRRELVRALRALRPEEWQRAGEHEVSGRITVLDVAAYIARHEEEHLTQLEEAGEERS